MQESSEEDAGPVEAGSIHPAHFQELKRKYSYDPSKAHQGDIDIDPDRENMTVGPVSPVMGAETEGMGIGPH